jgi:multidrug efflux pump subunit AcrB
MWIVRMALRRPYTIAVMCLLIVIMGLLSLSRMAVDIFPAIDIPVVAVVWQYNGLSAEDMERRVVLVSERAYSSSVNGIERIESQSIPGIGILKVYFQPGTEIGAAIAQMGATSSTVLRILPPGMTAPTILQFNASNVPVTQLTLSSKTMPEQKIFDYGLQFIRLKLFTIPGLSTPAPFGGKSRQVSIDIDPRALNAKGLAPNDVVTALSAANLILPAGSARMGSREYTIQMNSSPSTVEQFAQIPVKISGGQPVLLGDVAKIYDGFADQTNIVRVNGNRATYMAILKHAEASTLAVVDATREMLPAIRAAAPEGLEMKLDFDQSTFVRAAVKGVVSEALVSTVLVSLMILMFLGSWRSMAIVCTSIPLAILVGIIGLKLSGHTINIMTLGGLSLAIGMLVDDATVEVENIHRNLAMDKPLTVAILDGASQIAVPAIVATLAICIVFFPVVLLNGAARYLFTPLALAVVVSMLASYLLSRTLVPSLARMLMPAEHGGPGADHKRGIVDGFFHAFNPKRDKALDAFTGAYTRGLELLLAHRTFALSISGAIVALTVALFWVVGMDFFPSVDVGLMKLHFRAPSGMRIEETEKLIARLEDRIRQVIPPDQLDTINDMIGVPSGYNLAFVPTDNAGPMDGEILIQLKAHHRPTRDFMTRIRKELAPEFPGSTLYFQSADIVSQVLNFGTAAPVDLQVEGPDLAKDHEVARKLRTALQAIPGLVDVRIKQVSDYPGLRLTVDRQRAAQVGLTQRDVANNMLISLSSNAVVAPSFFLNPANGVNYSVVAKVPMEGNASIQALLGTPITTPAAGAILQPDAGRPVVNTPTANAQTLGNLATVRPISTTNEVDHATIQRVVDVMANVEGRDLGSVVKDIQRAVEGVGKLQPGMAIRLRGQNEVMQSSFRSLGLGMILAVVLVYLLMVVLFQSWVDPFIIMMAVPGALVGILWMLALTGTTLNVESLMGSIMAIGIATSNSILLVSFANDIRVEQPGLSAITAALEAGRTRLRPVLMTALAMIIGMIPMALGLGEAGEQNAPLGRAVIGGLTLATFVTLFVVPVIYSLLRVKPPTKHELEARFQLEQLGSQA